MTDFNFSKFVEELSSDFIPVVSSKFSKEQYIPIDLSESNVSLDTFDVSSSKAFEAYVVDYLNKNNAKVAYGGYHEPRGIYRRSKHFNDGDIAEERNIHLGLDLWCDAGTEILSPLDGEIHSFKNNNNYGDYGPTIILKHHIRGVEFYTLYGHLSTASISGLNMGDVVKAGDVIAILGDASVNGDYAPHLHFQIIKDLEGNVGDYPGVSSREELNKYKYNCPNPNLLLNI
ncbi:peptidoglycan DD-metalloendopeptidase family protein [Aquimarina sp. D1M17]|uniref:peptidoglycan DD-metalloendopeptidase family protein n=1 Tax=Aquimarina acroporae TaxID=2937283 RepID=UPI0020C0B9F3|nr:peptidoglycan DD-metalloendopeptidase family protein [Aquimarina acroporae]MCK8522014.1 peptidoglycan DD-metalloendopeptidase family protein [Aquimarina acroporae]